MTRAPSNPTGAMLIARGLVKIYGRRRVVDGVEFDVQPGEIVGLLGPNGAGKTTSFRMTCGMIEPDAGQVLLQGIDVTHWPMYRRARDGGMGYLAQESSVFRKLSVEKNLLAVMELLGFDRPTRRRRCEELLEQFKITRLRKSLAMSLSGGERRRLEIARALVSNPKIILLDEPFTGIDPVTIASIQNVIRDLRDRGISILITDHQVRETLQITDRSYVIRDGKVLCHGSPQEVIQNADARKYYFGEGMDIHLPPQQQRPADLAAANLAADLAARDRWLVESYAAAAGGPEIVVEESAAPPTVTSGDVGEPGTAAAPTAGPPLSGPHRPPAIAYDDLGLIVPKRKKPERPG